VPERARTPAFVAFVLVVGTLLAIVLGGLVAGSLDAFNDGVLLDLAFPMFLLAGWLLAVPAAGALFGYPQPKPLRSYVPRLAPEERPAALVPLTLVLGLVLTIVLGMALGQVPRLDLEDAALAALIAFPIAFVLAARLLHVPLRGLDPRGLTRVPERAKPLVVLTVGLLLGTLLWALIGQVLTGFVEGASLGYALAFAFALLAVDSPFLLGASRARKQRKAKEQEIEARLRRELGLASDEPKPAGTASRFGRRGRGS
jgi:hypothetical protein